ncbi:hypothetical protein CANINC_001350 [Pichia inconspicua]|uniref:Nudix hydrolase domain-containing protein n=1 Tax=Pichia inconspicua TaxID=52247 RepID=A0A4T0X5I4_9ASCO|nr:hypothetical protein CANINC_001350 [[Candida] inconspicua]
MNNGTPITHTIDPSTADKTQLDLLDVVLTSKAREGRENQLYSSLNGARLVAGGIILNDNNEKVLMISSSKHKVRWIIPKGGVEVDEKDNFAIAALREVWEEAGAVAVVVKKLDVINDHRLTESSIQTRTESNVKERSSSSSSSSSHDSFPICEFHFYQMKLVRLENVWPECDNRQRKWCSYEEACRELRRSKRPELLTALNSSDIVK